MSYPTLSINPVSIEVEPISATIKSESEKGYVQTRERHTRDRHKLSVTYMVEKTDRDLIMSHFSTVRGSVIFSFTDFETTTTYNVRYSTPPKYKIEGSTPNLYNLTFELEEV